MKCGGRDNVLCIQASWITNSAPGTAGHNNGPLFLPAPQDKKQKKPLRINASVFTFDLVHEHLCRLIRNNRKAGEEIRNFSSSYRKTDRLPCACGRFKLRQGGAGEHARSLLPGEDIYCCDRCRP